MPDDTTLDYARLYNGRVIADYYQAMGEIEGRLGWREGVANTPPDSRQLLLRVDALQGGHAQ